MNHFKQIVKVIVNVFTWILFAILVLVIYGKATVTFTNRNYPNYFGYTFFEVASGSMEPTLYINDVILVKITKENLNKDDIIAFEQGKTIITHRVIFVDNDIITVKGDNNNTIDKPINRNAVIGKVVKIYSKLGVWKKVLSEPKIIFTLFITLLLFDFALSYSKEDENKIKTNNNKENESSDKKDLEKLLDITKKIDIKAINDMIDDEDHKLSNKEVKNLEQKVSNLDDDIEIIDVSDELLKKHKFTEKEKDFIEYTMRLDLNEIMNRINRNLK